MQLELESQRKTPLAAKKDQDRLSVVPGLDWRHARLEADLQVGSRRPHFHLREVRLQQDHCHRFAQAQPSSGGANEGTDAAAASVFRTPTGFTGGSVTHAATAANNDV